MPADHDVFLSYHWRDHALVERIAKRLVEKRWASGTRRSRSTGTARPSPPRTPVTPGWQRDLVVGHFKVGGILEMAGETEAALKQFRDGQSIAERPVRLDPGNAKWQADLETVKNTIAKLTQAATGGGKAAPKPPGRR